ncbi:MAG: patatin-like phospholipase family protein [Desulfovermiculus sp.]|nr:patatin-like phospholipase family protein [Desulfovermiculus sp.]
MSVWSPKISLALSYGGAKGLAHVGVLQVLQEQGYQFGRIAGTSAGAIIGAMFAETMDAHVLEQRFRELIASDIFQGAAFSRFMNQTSLNSNFWNQISCRIRDTVALYMAQSKISLLSADRFIQCLEMLIHVQDFAQCRLPFVAVATDMTNGQDMPLCAGSLIQAVLASSSIPGFFPPVDMDGVLLNDGAICCPVPVKYAQDLEENVLLAVSVPPKIDPLEPIESALSLMIRAEEINLSFLCQAQAANADVVIEPETKDVGWNEMHRLDEMLESGRQAAFDSLPQIEEAMETRHPWWRRLKTWH